MEKRIIILTGWLVVAFKIGFTQIQLPSGMPDPSELILWLSPDSGVYRNNNTVANIGNKVKEWRDLSGNNFTFTTTSNSFRPELVKVNGLNYLDFSNGDFMQNLSIQNTINGLTQFSMFFVIKSDLVNTDNGFLDSENPNGTDDKVCLRYDKSGANTRRTNLIKSGLGSNVSSQQVETMSGTQTTDRQVLTITWSINNPLKVYIDGVINETSTNNINSALSGLQKIIIGKGPKNTNSNSGWDGKIGTVLFYKKEFNADTIASISNTIQTIYSVKTGNWNDPTTWQCNCIPTIENDVEIRSSHHVTYNNDADVNNLFIAGNSSLIESTSTSNSISIAGNFVNKGNYQAANSTVVFQGTKLQKISGRTVFSSIRINNTSGVQIQSGNIDIEKELSLLNGTLETNDLLTFISNASGTARLDEVSNGSITGLVTVERYIDAGSTNWRNLSSPVKNIPLSQWNDDFITSGFPGSNFPSFPFTSIYSYDEKALGNKSNGYIPASNINNIIAPGAGLIVWCGDTITGTQPFTIDVTGELNIGTISIPVDYTNDPSQPASEDGWNLIGNPYASTIDWDDPNWTKSGINDAIYVWDPDAEQYSSYIAGVGNNGGSRYIPSSQSFWIQTNNNANLVINEMVKSKQSTNFFRQKSPQSDMLKINIQGKRFGDETVVRFNSLASKSFDEKWDARKIYSNSTNVPSIVSRNQGLDYAINTIAAPTKRDTITLHVQVPTTGNYSINLNPIITGKGVGCMFFEDRLLNVQFPLTADTTYNCLISDTLSYNRFNIIIGAAAIHEIVDNNCFGDSNAKIVIQPNDLGPYDYTWQNEDDVIINSTKNTWKSDSLTGLSEGTYSVEIKSQGICGTINRKFKIKDPAQVIAKFEVLKTEEESSLRVKLNNLSENGINYLWKLEENVTSEQASPFHTFNSPGKYTVSLIASDEKKCADTTFQIIDLRTVSKMEEKEVTQKLLHIYPNPSKSVVNVDVRRIKGNHAELYVMQLDGTTVEHQSIQVKPGQQAHQVSVEKLQPGFYIFTLIDETESWTSKVSVIK